MSATTNDTLDSDENTENFWFGNNTGNSDTSRASLFSDHVIVTKIACRLATNNLSAASVNAFTYEAAVGTGSALVISITDSTSTGSVSAELPGGVDTPEGNNVTITWTSNSTSMSSAIIRGLSLRGHLSNA